MSRPWWWLVAVAALGACAGPVSAPPPLAEDEVSAERDRQLAYVLREQAALNRRLLPVSHQLMVANRNACGTRTAPLLGLWAISASELAPDRRHAGVDTLGLHWSRPTVMALVADGPAAKAGIAVGDIIMAVDDTRLEGGGGWLMRHMEKVERRDTYRLEIARAGKTITREVRPVAGCAVPVRVLMQADANAFTDGEQIVIQTGMFRMAQTDGELAVILGHELAHITMNHLRKRRQNEAAGEVAGALFDIGFGAAGLNTRGGFARAGAQDGFMAYAQDFEREADYVGLYMAARSGFDTAGAERVWRAISLENPRAISFAGTHPTAPERFVMLQKTNTEIAEKRRLGVALVPDRRADRTPVAAAATE